MKYLLTIFLAVMITSFSAQSISHPSVESLKVNYKSVNLIDTSFVLHVIPQATITLKDSISIEKIFFRIYDLTSDSLIYQVNYLINTSTQLTGNIIQYDYYNGVVRISPASSVVLKPYRYRIQTSDSSNVITNHYISIK